MSSLIDNTMANECLLPNGSPRELYAPLLDWMESSGRREVAARTSAAATMGAMESFTFQLDPLTFRATPVDMLPRLLLANEWAHVTAGVEQRQRALNLFLLDLYCAQQPVVPLEVVYSCDHFYPEVSGIRPRKDVFVHLYGADLVRDVSGQFVVLEDNLRIPSGISYQLKTSELAARTFPEFADIYRIEQYNLAEGFRRLFRTLESEYAGPAVILTDSKYGAAFFEHRYLSELLKIPLVEGHDLYRDPEGRIRARTLDGDFVVDVVYRRVEDIERFVPGMRQSYREGRVGLVNALGTGAADDKLVFRWVPDMIRHYLGEEPILRQAETHNLLDESTRRHVLGNLDSLVIKSRAGYGGFGVAIGPELSSGQREEVEFKVSNHPEAYVGQEIIDFSKHLVFDGASGQVVERYVDLRVFSIQDGDGVVTVPVSPLTRVSPSAARITNNSSGGLCKPTWVVSPR